MIQPHDIGAHRFGHQAMATEFEIFCVHPDRDYAQQAAWAAFDLLDRLESELSRFLENSDIARINSLRAGETTRVSSWTMDCLQLARHAHQETGGAFDISLGTGLHSLHLVERDRTVCATAEGVRLDLGGMGKGYAVDRMAEVLLEWDIPQALLHGGHSSVLAMDAPPGFDGWPLTMHGAEVQACQSVYSASGTRKGDHIVDPRTGQPVTSRQAAWASAKWQGGPSPSAVVEAFSTAFMILPAEEIAAICARHPGLTAWVSPNELRTTLCVQNSH